jgi:hypothetical protein
MILPATARKTGGICMPCAKGFRVEIEKSKALGNRKMDEDLGPVSPDLYAWGNLFIIIIAYLLVNIAIVAVWFIYFGIVSGFFMGAVLLVANMIFIIRLFGLFEDIAQKLAIWQYDRYFSKRGKK